ncbi:hypothetical protein Taro_016386 [Colocasia esculenta]|uniref:Transposase Tnp1/En/Spm-like domain-containing protein n=1 Tax=Colocasia esculenta TaxID=4460 RepID=A0A843UW52_COLES|nr:hypothetical protein [Colocasia esculenta]
MHFRGQLLERKYYVLQRSAMNKLNREKQIVGHTTGSKSFAMIREEICQKRDDARNPSRAELFSITHTRKDGHPVNEESARVMGMLQEISSPEENTSPKTMKDDLLSQVLGKDKLGRIRMLGLGPTPSSVYGPVPTRAQALQMVNQVKTSSETVISKMFEKIEEMKVEHEKMKESYENRLSNLHVEIGTLKDLMQQNNENYQVQRGLKKRGRNNDNVNVQGKAMVYLKSFKKSLVNVALATIESKDLLKKVGGCDLGCEYWEVAINVALVYNEPLPRPYAQFKTIGDAIGATIAWPFTLRGIRKNGIQVISEMESGKIQNGGKGGFYKKFPVQRFIFSDNCKGEPKRWIVRFKGNMRIGRKFPLLRSMAGRGIPMNMGANLQNRSKNGFFEFILDALDLRVFKLSTFWNDGYT